MMLTCRRTLVSLFVTLLLAATPALARDVAFVEPGGGGNGAPEEAFKIEPKSDIDIGDSILNIVRRETLFFVNQGAAPIKIEKVAISSDSTVAAVITNDDCSKEGIIPPLSRCSIELSVTPIGPGSWGIELLMTHDGPGRITRATIAGKTAGSDASDRHDRGLSLSGKDSKPVDFGEVTVGSGKIVRSALMVNDSPSTITIYSIDVIEADKSLQRLDSGCSADMDLKPGESCPITLVWAPTGRMLISTDMIIRHSGQLGFAVIPVRGVAKSNKKEKDEDVDTTPDTSAANKAVAAPPVNVSGTAKIAAPPTPAEVAKEVSKAVGSGSALPGATGAVHLIGTVGSRAVLLKPDGTTAIAQMGDSVDLGDGSAAKVISVGGTTASLMIGGKKKDLNLEAVQELKDHAMASKKGGNGKDVAGNGGKDNAAGGLQDVSAGGFSGVGGGTASK